MFESGEASTNNDCDKVQKMDREFMSHSSDRFAIFFKKRAREFEGLLFCCSFTIQTSFLYLTSPTNYADEKQKIASLTRRNSAKMAPYL